MGTDGRFCPHHRWDGYPDAHQVLVLAQNTEVGMDARVHQLAIDGSRLVFSPGLSELSKFHMAKQGVLKIVKGSWHDDEFRVLEVSWISQCCQQGVTGHNR